MRRLSAFALMLAFVSRPALAHDTGVSHLEPPDWTLDPAIIMPLVVTAFLFASGWVRLRRRSTKGAAKLMVRARLFGAGWLILAAALVSPLHEAGERSFAAHMFEHELIMLAAAPLLVLSQPFAVMLWAFPNAGRHSLGSATRSRLIDGPWQLLSAPVAATLIQAAALWLWHAPALFDLALANEGWHAAQHLSFLTSALLFWTAMLSRRTAAGVSALCLVVTSIVSGALGALMAFATSPWYSAYEQLGMAPFGLTPAEDQQVAGLLMWVPGGLVHAGAALLIMRRLLRPSPA